MARYLSPGWFAEAGATGEQDADGDLVLEQVVDAAPEGTVVYRVVVKAHEARIVWPVPDGAPPADLSLSCAWQTAVAIARGDEPAQRALMAGRLRVSGDPRRLARDGIELGGIDPVPASVRRATSYASD